MLNAGSRLWFREGWVGEKLYSSVTKEKYSREISRSRKRNIWQETIVENASDAPTSPPLVFSRLFPFVLFQLKAKYQNKILRFQIQRVSLWIIYEVEVFWRDEIPVIWSVREKKYCNIWCVCQGDFITRGRVLQPSHGSMIAPSNLEYIFHFAYLKKILVKSRRLSVFDVVVWLPGWPCWLTWHMRRQHFWRVKTIIEDRYHGVPLYLHFFISLSFFVLCLCRLLNDFLPSWEDPFSGHSIFTFWSPCVYYGPRCAFLSRSERPIYVSFAERVGQTVFITVWRQQHINETQERQPPSSEACEVPSPGPTWGWEPNRADFFFFCVPRLASTLVL